MVTRILWHVGEGYSPHTTGTSLIIVVCLHTFKTTSLFRSALAKPDVPTPQKGQVGPLEHTTKTSLILVWDLWDELRTGVLEIVLLVV